MNPPSGEVRRVADVILARIMEGAYARGLRLPPETGLAAELGCGRSTVREALRHLADLGLVQSRRGSGAMVRDWRREGTPSLLPAYLRAGRFDVAAPELAAQLLRIRTMMAIEAVRLAASFAPPGSLDEAQEHLSRGPALEAEPAEHAINELEMYRALVRASGMWPAVWMVNALWGPLNELNRMFAPAIGSVPPDYQPTMERLFGLIAAGKAEAAARHVQRWFAQVDARLVRAIAAIVAAPSEPAPAARRARRASGGAR